MKALSIRLVLSAFFLTLGLPSSLLLPSRAFADELIQPPDGKSWGDPDAAQTLLKMNKDPSLNDPVERPRRQQEADDSAASGSTTTDRPPPLGAKAH